MSKSIQEEAMNLILTTKKTSIEISKILGLSRSEINAIGRQCLSPEMWDEREKLARRELVFSILSAYDKGQSLAEIGKAHNLCRASISRIVKKRWSIYNDFVDEYRAANYGACISTSDVNQDADIKFITIEPHTEKSVRAEPSQERSHSPPAPLTDEADFYNVKIRIKDIEINYRTEDSAEASIARLLSRLVQI